MLKIAVVLGSVVILAAGSTPARAATKASEDSVHAARQSQLHLRGPLVSPSYTWGSHFAPAFAFEAELGYGPFFAQSFGWPGFGFGDPSPFYASAQYLYFYDRYDQEARQSKRDADEFEASLQREGKLTGPAEVGAFATDSVRFLPHEADTTLDGIVQDPSPSGAALVIGSGHHTIRIAAKEPSAGD